mgnify:CR=1 FL=1
MTHRSQRRLRRPRKRRAQGALDGAPAAPNAPTRLFSKDVFLNPGVWLVGITLMVYLIAEQGVISFLPTYLAEVRGMDAAAASSIVSIAPLVGIPVGIVAGMVSDKMGSRKKPLGVLMLASAVTYALMPTWPTGVFIVLVVLFGIATPHLTPGLSAIMASSELPCGIALSALVIGEPVEALQAVGIVAILAGIAISQLPHMRAQAEAAEDGLIGPALLVVHSGGTERSHGFGAVDELALVVLFRERLVAAFLHALGDFFHR